VHWCWGDKGNHECSLSSLQCEFAARPSRTSKSPLCLICEEILSDYAWTFRDDHSRYQQSPWLPRTISTPPVATLMRFEIGAPLQPFLMLMRMKKLERGYSEGVERYP